MLLVGRKTWSLRFRAECSEGLKIVSVKDASACQALQQEGFRAEISSCRLSSVEQADSQLADDFHEIVHLSVHGCLADFQVLLHADAGKERQDHLREDRRFHGGLFGFDISRDQIFEKSAAR